MTPGTLREALAQLQNEMRDIEKPVEEKVAAGMVLYIAVQHELAEAWDAIQRAVEHLDENYKSMS